MLKFKTMQNVYLKNQPIELNRIVSNAIANSRCLNESQFLEDGGGRSLYNEDCCIDYDDYCDNLVEKG